MTFLSLSFYLFAKGAGSAIPRSSVLNGAKKSVHGDTNILLLGLDSRRDNNGNNLPRKLLDTMHVGSSSAIGGYNTNTMILIHIPADGSHAVAISIPRDDYVDVAGYGPQKIPIDHFAEVNLVGFYDLANAIGGVQVCLNHAVNDAKYSGAILPAGLQTITGTQALAFVRQRHGLPNGDLDRTHRQQAFITGVITKFRTQGLFGDLGKLKGLLGVAQKDVVIDSGWDVLGFLPQAKALTGGHITFHTLPIEGYAMRNSQSVNLIDIPTVQKFTHDLFYPAPKSTASTSPSPSSTKSATAKPFNFAHLANGDAVNGAGIPCVN